MLISISKGLKLVSKMTFG